MCIDYGDTEITMKFKKPGRFQIPNVEPQSDFDCSDNECDANDNPMIRLRLVSHTLRQDNKELCATIDKIAMRQNNEMYLAVEAALKAKPIKTHYHQNKARGGVGRYAGESDQAFVKRMKNNAASRKSRNKSKVIRVTTTIRWKKLQEQNKGMRKEMRLLRHEMLQNLELLEKSNKQHLLTKCFSEDAIVQFVYDKYGPYLYGNQSPLLEMLAKCNWNFVEQLLFRKS